MCPNRINEFTHTYIIIMMTGRVSGTGPEDSGWLRGQRSQDSRRASQVHHEGEL